MGKNILEIGDIVQFVVPRWYTAAYGKDAVDDRYAVVCKLTDYGWRQHGRVYYVPKESLGVIVDIRRDSRHVVTDYVCLFDDHYCFVRPDSLKALK